MESKIILDYKTINVSSLKNLNEKLPAFQIKNDQHNLLTMINEGEPDNQTKHKIKKHDLQYNGRTCKEKFKDVAHQFRSTFEKYDSKSIYALVINKLDEIAWLTNLRGSDIESNPVFFSYGILFMTPEENYMTMYIDSDKINNNISDYLKDNSINLKEYSEFYSDLQNFEKKVNINIVLDRKSCNYYMYDLISSNVPRDNLHLIDNNPN